MNGIVTNDPKALLDYAQQFFTMGNAIAAACLLQTAAFMLSFAKDKTLVATMLRWRPYTSLGAFLTSAGYVAAVCYCYRAEWDLRVAAGQEAALSACKLGFQLRLWAVIGVSLGYLQVFREVCREEDWLNQGKEDRSEPVPRLAHRLMLHEWLVRKIAGVFDWMLFSAPLKSTFAPHEYGKDTCEPNKLTRHVEKVEQPPDSTCTGEPPP